MSHLYDGCAEHGDVSIVQLVLDLLRGQIVVRDLDLLGCNVNILLILAFRICGNLPKTAFDFSLNSTCNVEYSDHISIYLLA